MTVLLLLMSLHFVSCNDSQGKYISSIMPMAEDKPDSALLLLSRIDQTKLSEKDLALYSLTYTMAQDKTGHDVDNDSLLRYAYNWYRNKPADSLYARCLYYMGKYYALNDSSEIALRCFSNAITAAKRQGDNYTQSLALLQYSIIVREYSPALAIQYAKKANTIYNNESERQPANKVYGLLNLAECYTYKENSGQESVNLAKEAISMAKGLNDSLAISDAYQDLSLFYSMLGDRENALEAANAGFRYKTSKRPSSYLTLAWTYYDVDSLPHAKALINQIPKQDYDKLDGSIYSLLFAIALKSKDYATVSAYKDSIVSVLETENAVNAKAKDTYYNNLIGKEKLRAKAQKESQLKNLIIVFIIISSLIIISFVLYISRNRREQMKKEYEEQQERKRLIIEHQKTQLATMRNFLTRKIDIAQKIKSLKAEDADQVLLTDDDWEELEVFLNNTYNDFVERLKHKFSLLTKNDIRFLMLIKLELTYPTIAKIYHIEPKSVKQKLFLLKGKLGLKNSQESTKKFIESY